MNSISLRIALLLMVVGWAALAQTNSPGPEAVLSQNGPELSPAGRYENTRLSCIQFRRIICGRIMKVLPDGWVVESGYTNLMRSPLNKSWLIPGTVAATLPANLVEEKEPDAICVGLVFLADLPKGHGKPKKPKLYDYVNVEGFPIGLYTYTSVGSVHRTVRRFTTKLAVATQWHFDLKNEESNPASN
jgi:hypothetical protein